MHTYQDLSSLYSLHPGQPLNRTGVPLNQQSVSLKRQHQEASTLPLTTVFQTMGGTQSILKCPCYLPGMWIRTDSWNFSEIMSHDFKCFCYYAIWSKNSQNYCSRSTSNCLLIPISTSWFLLTDLAFNRKAVLYYPRKYFWYGSLVEQNGFYTYTLLWPSSVFHSSGRGCTSVAQVKFSSASFTLLLLLLSHFSRVRLCATP